MFYSRTEPARSNYTWTAASDNCGSARVRLGIEQAGEHGRVRRGAHDHRLVAPADRDLRARERIGSDARGLADVFRQDDLAIQTLGQVLQPRRDIDRVAERREHGVPAKADVADDDFAAVDADAELDRLAHFGGELVIQVGDVRGDQRGGAQRLPACGRRIDVEPEQGEHAVADELVRLTAGRDHRLRGRLDETG